MWLQGVEGSSWCRVEPVDCEDVEVLGVCMDVSRFEEGRTDDAGCVTSLRRCLIAGARLG